MHGISNSHHPQIGGNKKRIVGMLPKKEIEW